MGGGPGTYTYQWARPALTVDAIIISETLPPQAGKQPHGCMHTFVHGMGLAHPSCAQLLTCRSF
jgi:hypothetical protein